MKVFKYPEGVGGILPIVATVLVTMWAVYHIFPAKARMAVTAQTA